jgi:hypothetical protein
MLTGIPFLLTYRARANATTASSTAAPYASWRGRRALP